MFENLDEYENTMKQRFDEYDKIIKDLNEKATNASLSASYDREKKSISETIIFWNFSFIICILFIFLVALWSFYDLKEILNFDVKTAIAQLEQSKDAIKGYLPYVDIKAFEQGIIDNYASTEKVLLCEDGDLLIVGDGSRSGLTGRAIKGIVGSTLYKIYADGMTTDYLRYFIESKYLLLNTQKKGTGTPHLNANILKKSKLIVPSIEEQERIVANIEELFSDLDNAVETLNATKTQLEVYRQAVLKEAFEGKLTAKWRERNNIDYSFNKVNIKALVKIIAKSKTRL